VEVNPRERSMIKFSRDFMAGAVVGFGAGLATRYLNEKGNGTALRSTAKNALKWGAVSYRSLREQMGQLKENFEDLVAEANAEVNAPPPVKSPTSKRTQEVKAAS
jgi:Protein of unknown function (DUF5132)